MHRLRTHEPDRALCGLFRHVRAGRAEGGAVVSIDTLATTLRALYGAVKMHELIGGDVETAAELSRRWDTLTAWAARERRAGREPRFRVPAPSICLLGAWYKRCRCGRWTDTWYHSGPNGRERCPECHQRARRAA